MPELAIALDTDDLVVAVRWARDLRPWFTVAKVGLELYSAVGPDALGPLADLGYDIFCDLKFHDIPTTVERAAQVVGSLGVKYLNFHAQGGLDMLRAGVEGLRQGADGAGLPAPIPLAVTVLTSDGAAPPGALAERVRLALDAGCGGIVCAAEHVREAKEYGSGLVAVVPGIRPAGTDVNDQALAATPAAARDAGADVLVLGRAVTRAADPAAAAAAVAVELSTS
jgi:orotidine-5'-phosphate decarboxylase